MSLKNQRELDNTREKLRLLDASYEELRSETGGDEELRAAEMESLKRLINQFKEEIAWYETRQPAPK
jgi:flagellar biosynthesis chaperone FliJ